MLSENLRDVEKRIEEACKRSNRDPKEVTLIAVSKTKPVEMLQEVYDAGARNFGENKVQEIMDKYDHLPQDIHWHMIGHLQRNKVKYIVDKVQMIHSVDSLRLAQHHQLRRLVDLLHRLERRLQRSHDHALPLHRRGSERLPLALQGVRRHAQRHHPQPGE